MKHKDKSSRSDVGTKVEVKADPGSSVKWRNGFKAPVVRCIQNGKEFYVAVIDIRDLKPVAFVEILTKDNKRKGRQRPLSPAHVATLQRDMVSGCVFPESLVCSPMNGAEIRDDNGQFWLFVPETTGKFLHVDQGNHRNHAAWNALAKGEVKGWQFLVSLEPYDTLMASKALRVDLTSNIKTEDKAVNTYQAHQVGKGLTIDKQAAGEVVIMLNDDEKSKVFDRIHYFHNQQPSKLGKRLPFNQVVDVLKSMWDVPHFGDLTRQEQYAIVDVALSFWAEETGKAWQDQSAYVCATQTGLLGFMMAMPFVLVKAIQNRGDITPDAVVEVVSDVAKRLIKPRAVSTHENFLNSRFGSGYPHRDAFKRMIVDALHISTKVKTSDGRKATYVMEKGDKQDRKRSGISFLLTVASGMEETAAKVEDNVFAPATA